VIPTIQTLAVASNAPRSAVEPKVALASQR
jgi:hypothetical protein